MKHESQCYKKFKKNKTVKTNEVVVFDSYGCTEKRKDDLFRQSECKHLGLNGGRLIGPYQPRVFFADSIESRDPNHSFFDAEKAEAYWYPYFQRVALSDAICDIGDVTKLIDNVTKLIQKVHITSATTCANVPMCQKVSALYFTRNFECYQSLETS